MNQGQEIRLEFDETAVKDILEYFDKTIDEEDYIVEKSNPEQRVLTIEGEEIKSSEFGGIKKGSEVFIKKDLVSLFRLAKHGV